MNDSPSTAVRTWLKGFRPLTLNARPRDCLRAGLGACIGALAAVFACQALFGSELALRLAAPLGASAVLLFALASSPLAQPWSMLGGNLVAALAGGLSAYWFGHDLAPALVGMALGMLLMFALRCLHPPSCALALSVALNPSLSELGIDVVWPILLSTLVLIGCALLYNNLMRSPTRAPTSRRGPISMAPATWRRARVRTSPPGTWTRRCRTSANTSTSPATTSSD